MTRIVSLWWCRQMTEQLGHSARYLTAGLLLCLLLASLTGCASADRPLQLLGGEGPRYPDQAQADGIEGEVVVGYDVTAAGQVVNAYVVQAQPPGLFDAAALQAVRSWQFKAPLVSGVPQAVMGLQSTVVFKLGQGDEYDQY